MLILQTKDLQNLILQTKDLAEGACVQGSRVRYGPQLIQEILKNKKSDLENKGLMKFDLENKGLTRIDIENKGFMRFLDQWPPLGSVLRNLFDSVW